MREILHNYANRLVGNRLPGLLRELADAIEEEEDIEQLRRLGSSLREMGAIASNRMRMLRDER